MTGIKPRSLFAASFIAIIAVITSCASIRKPEPAQDDGSSRPPAAGMEELLAGRFPGVEVLRVPSGGISIRIRGTSTFMGSTEPLYIIDGARVQSGPGGLLFLDPGDILKIEVLKDIGSTSLYGSEGANGVVLITTKRRL